MNNESPKTLEFSLVGGPLHRTAHRMGLLRKETDTALLGLVLGPGIWGVLILLALAQGLGQKMFSLFMIGAHARLLLAIPLFFTCETLVFPMMAEFVQGIVRSGVVPDHALPALESEIARVVRWRESWLLEASCLLFAGVLPLIGTQLPMIGATATYSPEQAVMGGKTMASYWYWFVGLPLFRFLMVRWAWRLALWWIFLLRVAKLELNLVPTHPDGVGGLGYLEVVQTHFTPLVAAISVVQSAALAEELSTGAMAFEGVYPVIAFLLVLNAALFMGPLFSFSPKLWACRMKGLRDYMGLASNYVNRFDRKWIGPHADPGGSLLGTPDLQSLADLGNSVNIVRNMRWVPLSRRLGTDMAIAALLPVLPLLLLKYPMTELVEKFFRRLSGL